MPPAAANGQGTWDLKAAARAAAEEGDDVPFTFAYEGGQYTIPASRKWPARAVAALDEGNLSVVLTYLLGAEAWDELCEAGLELGEIEQLFEKIAEHNGFDKTDTPKGPRRLPNSGPPAARSSARR